MKLYVTNLQNIGITLSGVSNYEQVQEVECYIINIKEQCHAIYNNLPLDKLLYNMIIKMVKYDFFWINSSLAGGGVSETLIPRKIVFGASVDYYNHCNFEYGAYLQAQKQYDNLIITQTTGDTDL